MTNLPLPPWPDRPLSNLPDEWQLTEKEACAVLHCSRPTLGRLRRLGLLRWTRLGARGVRIPLGALREFLTANTETEPDLALGTPRRRPRTSRASG